MADDETSDSPWSSEQEESLSEDGDSSTAEDGTGFFVTAAEGSDQPQYCPFEIKPREPGVPRKTIALHMQLFDLSEALFCLDRPQLAGRFSRKFAATVWQTATQAIITLNIPRRGKAVKDDATEEPAKKAFAWIYRRLLDVQSRFRHDAAYRIRLSGGEARAHVQFFTRLDKIIKTADWQDICNYEARYPVPDTLLKPYNLDIQQRLLRLLLHQILGGPEAEVLDLSSLAVWVREPDLINTFPWTDALKWFADESSNTTSDPLSSSSTQTSRFQRYRLAVRFIDLTENCFYGVPNILFGVFTYINCIAGAQYYGPQLVECRALEHRHESTPPHWRQYPLSEEKHGMLRDPAIQLRAQQAYWDTMNRKPSQQLNRGAPCDLVDSSKAQILTRRTDSSPLGPPNLLDLTKRSILRHIDSNFPLSNRPVNVGPLVKALGIKIDTKIIVPEDTTFAQMNIAQRAAIERLAPGSLPLPLWKALLNSYYCGTCHRMSSTPSRKAEFRLSLPRQEVHGSGNFAGITTICTQICRPCNPRGTDRT